VARAALEERLGWHFHEPRLLLQALTHASYINEAKSVRAQSVAKEGFEDDNQRLEFLGDAVLELKVSELLYRRHRAWREGDLTRMRSQVVQTSSLARFAAQLKLGECLRLGRGEHRQGARRRPGLLADAFEALVAALYLDGADEVLDRLVRELVEQAGKRAGEDHKSCLQEMVQASGAAPPVYHLERCGGVDHRPRFEVEVMVAGRSLGIGHGPSRREAEQAAAAAALARLKKEENGDSLQP